MVIVVCGDGGDSRFSNHDRRHCVLGNPAITPPPPAGVLGVVAARQLLGTRGIRPVIREKRKHSTDLKNAKQNKNTSEKNSPA